MTTLKVRDADGAEVDLPINADPATGAKQTSLLAAAGAPADAAWSGSGDGGLVGLLKAIWNVLAGKGLAASGKTPVTGALVSSTLTAAFLPAPGRTFYLELTGTGSVTGAAVYLCNDGSSYAPNAVATDGGAPIILDKIAYSGGTQNGVRIALQVDQAGASVKFSPGVVTGPVNFAFVQ